MPVTTIHALNGAGTSRKTPPAAAAGPLASPLMSIRKTLMGLVSAVRGAILGTTPAAPQVVQGAALVHARRSR